MSDSEESLATRAQSQRRQRLSLIKQNEDSGDDTVRFHFALIGILFSLALQKISARSIN